MIGSGSSQILHKYAYSRLSTSFLLFVALISVHFVPVLSMGWECVFRSFQLVNTNSPFPLCSLEFTQGNLVLPLSLGFHDFKPENYFWEMSVSSTIVLGKSQLNDGICCSWIYVKIIYLKVKVENILNRALKNISFLSCFD